MDLQSLQRNWDDLGRKDPLWAVLTWPGKRGGQWRADEFFATGEAEVARLMSYLDSLSSSPRRRKALDFGCGVGRLTQPLAARYEQVVGVDIAPSMIEWARKFNGYGGRCTYLVNDGDDLSAFADGEFDLVLSKLTLQHMPPTYSCGFIAEFVRVLHPEGRAIFQAAGEPTLRRNPVIQGVRSTVRRLIPEGCIRMYRKARYGHLMDMYGLKREEVIGLLEANAAVVVDVVEDTSAGGGWTSFQYCARRASR